MTEQSDGELTRRQFVKWSFGILTVAVAASTSAFLQRLRQAESWTFSDGDETRLGSLTLTQYLQSRPSLSTEFSVQGDINHRTLTSQEAEFVVNESAYFVLCRCDGNTTVGQLCQALSTHFEVSYQRAQNDVLSFLNCLYSLDMMSFSLAYRLDREYKTETSGTSTWAAVTL